MSKKALGGLILAIKMKNTQDEWFFGYPHGNRSEQSERNSVVRMLAYQTKRHPSVLGFVQHSCAHRVCHSP